MRWQTFMRDIFDHAQRTRFRCFYVFPDTCHLKVSKNDNLIFQDTLCVLLIDKNQWKDKNFTRARKIHFPYSFYCLIFHDSFSVRALCSLLFYVCLLASCCLSVYLIIIPLRLLLYISCCSLFILKFVTLYYCFVMLYFVFFIIFVLFRGKNMFSWWFWGE